MDDALAARSSATNAMYSSTSASLACAGASALCASLRGLYSGRDSSPSVACRLGVCCRRASTCRWCGRIYCMVVDRSASSSSVAVVVGIGVVVIGRDRWSPVVVRFRERGCDVGTVRRRMVISCMWVVKAESSRIRLLQIVLCT